MTNIKISILSSSNTASADLAIQKKWQGEEEGEHGDALAFQDIFAVFTILYFACGIPHKTSLAAFLQGNPYRRFFYFQRRMSERSIAKLERDLGSPHPPFSKIRLFCLERPQGFSGLAPRPLLQLHSQQETCQPTGQRSGVGLESPACKPSTRTFGTRSQAAGLRGGFPA